MLKTVPTLNLAGMRSSCTHTKGDTFYLIEQKLRFCTTLGGYEATPEMQLLDADFKPVENFYAAGEIVGGANGKDSMPSMMNSWSYAYVFVAAPAPKPDVTSGASH